MLATKLVDPLDRVFSEAERIVAVRANLLTEIQKTEASLLTAEDDLSAVKRRASSEEFEAAQKPDGLALASDETQREATKAELKAKTIRLRLQGLQSQAGPIDAALLRAWADVESHFDAMLQERISDLSGEFDAAVDRLISLTCQALPLGKHALRRLGGIDLWHTRFQNLQVFNPLRLHGGSIAGGLIKDGGKMRGALNNCWDQTPEARSLNEELLATEERLAPVAAIVKTLRPKR